MKKPTLDRLIDRQMIDPQLPLLLKKRHKKSALSKFLIKNLTKHFFCVKLMKELNTTSEVILAGTTSDLINSDINLSK